MIPSLFLLLLVETNPLMRAANSSTRYEASHCTMFTVFTVVAYGSSTAFLQEATNQIFEEMDQLDGQMSTYEPDSKHSLLQP